jgi:hypothetical protein
LVDWTAVTPWAVLAVIVVALATAGLALGNRQVPAWALAATMVAAAALYLQFILVVLQRRTVDLGMGNHFIHLRLTAWGVLILVAGLAPVLAAVAVRLATTPGGRRSGFRLATRASVAAGWVMLVCSQAHVFGLDHTRSGYPDQWGFDFRCRGWQTCPRDTLSGVNTGDVPLLARLSVDWVDYTTLTRWVVLAAVIVAVTVPTSQLSGRLPGSRRARGHLVAVVITTGLLWLHQLLVVLERRPQPRPDLGDLTVAYYLRPTFWGGVILAASLVTLVAAVVIARHRGDGDRTGDEVRRAGVRP